MASFIESSLTQTIDSISEVLVAQHMKTIFKSTSWDADKDRTEDSNCQKKFFQTKFSQFLFRS